MVSLTIGMATYNDFDGVYFSVQAIRLYQEVEDTELLVVDNFGCEFTERFVRRVGGRYVRATEVRGTALPRDLVFQLAQGDAVLCLDSHVLFAPGVIGNLKDYYRAFPDTRDLLQGPLLHDGLDAVATNYDQTWRKHMWGRWQTDPRGTDPDNEPFEIVSQGLGVFSCRKEAWPGFNPAMRGYGGEEGYIHEKFRQRGGRCLCVPWMQWLHRFSRPSGVPYPILVQDKFRNHVIGHAEVGLDLRPLLHHFTDALTSQQMRSLLTESLPTWTDQEIDELLCSALAESEPGATQGITVA